MGDMSDTSLPGGGERTPVDWEAEGTLLFMGVSFSDRIFDRSVLSSVADCFAFLSRVALELDAWDEDDFRGKKSVMCLFFASNAFWLSFAAFGILYAQTTREERFNASGLEGRSQAIMRPRDRHPESSITKSASHLICINCSHQKLNLTQSKVQTCK